jgi:tryptophan halogenase
MKKNNIIVLGGGSAGWLTAIWAKKLIPDNEVTLVQSKEVGIIGVGEASTPHLPMFLNNLGIDVKDLIKKTNGSIKNGINFVNWNGDGQRYFHSFFEDLTDFSIGNITIKDGFDYYLKTLIHNELNFEDFLYQFRLAYDNRIDLKHTSWSIHFDSKLFAEYLETFGRQLGIKIIEKNFTSATQNNSGFITSIKLDSGQILDCDFLFDCTGFAKLIIHKLYDQKWISYSDYLPMKCAIPFWLESDNDIEPYTSSTAMKNGWMWKIPLQHRIGSGYIFDSDYINVDQAINEAENFYSRSLKINKIINFDPGRMENFWVKNCISVGLSSSFLEPIESTSLWVTTSQLDLLQHFLSDLLNPREQSLKIFNKTMNKTLDELSYFVYLHYMTKRQDSQFWKEFREKNLVPDGFRELFENLKNGNIRYLDIINENVSCNFQLASYLQVANGLKLFENPPDISGYKKLNPTLTQYKEICMNYTRQYSIKNKIFLQNI